MNHLLRKKPVSDAIVWLPIGCLASRMFSSPLVHLCILIISFAACTAFCGPKVTQISSRLSVLRNARYGCRIPSFSTQMSMQAELDKDFLISDVLIGDMLDVIYLANNQFVKSTDNFLDIVRLDYDILMLFLPKLLLPGRMRHSVIGVRSADDNKLVGFVDLSLQLSSGSLDALKPKTLAARKLQYGDKNLAPYLCNLFVSPVHRKKGLARKLIAACEVEARKWGCNCINLHVELSSRPALNLYLSSNFEVMKQTDNDVVFMSKKLPK